MGNPFRIASPPEPTPPRIIRMGKWQGERIKLEWTQGEPTMTLSLGEPYANQVVATVPPRIARDLHSALGIALAETSQAGGDGDAR